VISYGWGANNTMKNKIMTAQEAVAGIKDGASIMVGGFMACGTPEILIDALVEKGVKNLTIICNDAGVPGRGVGKLLSNGQIKTLIASHVGLNPEVAQRMNTDVPEDKLECILVPQGTLAERVRAGGAGLGGFLTPTGVGTIVAEGKQVINIDGRDYLLEKPLKADVALIRARETDKFGNTTITERQDLQSHDGDGCGIRHRRRLRDRGSGRNRSEQCGDVRHLRGRNRRR